MQDEPDPPRKFYQLKPKEFEPVNAIPPPLPEIPSTVPPTALPTDAKIDVHDLFRIAGRTGPLLRRTPGEAAVNEVHGMLRENHARAEAAGLNEVALRPRRRSRRRRDFFLLLLGGNAVVALTTVFNPILGVGAIALYNTGLIWIMWFVMDDY